MEVYTIGFAKRTAGEFFEALKQARIKRLLDVRLNNSSQLAGFTKRADLPYLLQQICGADYTHEPLLAPTQDLLDDFKKRKGSWSDYERRFLELMENRRVADRLDRTLFSVPTVLLCSERTAAQCHRRLVLEYLGREWGDISMVHL